MKKTVFITGAAKRVGASIAHILAREGWEVVLHYNNSGDEAVILSEKLKSLFPGREFPVLQCDLSDTNGVLALFERLPRSVDHIDALINNASVFDAGSIEETNPALLRKEMAVNFEAPFFLIQTFKNFFGKGAIVNLLDAKIEKNEGAHTAYILAKKSLAELTRMAALAFAPHIRINAIAPGPVLRPRGKNDNYLKQVVDHTPLKRQVDTDDIAMSVSFLLNNPSVTGQILFCDSGSHLI